MKITAIKGGVELRKEININFGEKKFVSSLGDRFSEFSVVREIFASDESMILLLPLFQSSIWLK